MQNYTDMLDKVAPGTDPRHILALLQSRDGHNALHDLNTEQAAFCIAMAKVCVQVFGADLVKGIARERGI